MWQLDGWGARVRIGILMPHFDVGPEVEFVAMAPEGVTINSTRVRIGVVMPGAATDPEIALAPVRAFAEPPAIDDAAELLAAAPLHAIAYGFFSSSYVLGVEGDRALQARLEKRTCSSDRAPMNAAPGPSLSAIWRHLDFESHSASGISRR